MVFSVEVRGDQSSKRQKRFLTQMRLVSDLYLSALLRQHPGRNFQSLPGRVNDADRSIAPLGPADDLQGSAEKWVKGVEDLNIRMIGTQGILRVGALIRISIVSCLPEGYRPTGNAGSHPAGRTSFCQSNHSAGCSGESSWNNLRQRFSPEISVSTVLCGNSLTQSALKPGWNR